MAKLIFELKDIHYSYLGKIPALCGINMQIEEGSKIAVVGANGCGKSTLLQMLDGLIFPDKGSICACGKELKESVFNDLNFSSAFRKKIGFVFQNPEVQLFCPTVEEDILFGPLQLGIDKKEIRKRFEKLIEFLDIKDLIHRPPYRLSIGEKRKVAIATTLIIEPEVIILDEPTAGLDPQTTRHIIDIILAANSKGKTIISATHDLHIINEIADIVYILGKDRKIARSGAPEELLNDTAFLQNNNLVHMHPHKHKDATHTHPHQHLDHHI